MTATVQANQAFRLATTNYSGGAPLAQSSQRMISPQPQHTPGAMPPTSSMGQAPQSVQRSANKVNWLIFGVLFALTVILGGLAGWIYLSNCKEQSSIPATEFFTSFAKRSTRIVDATEVAKGLEIASTKGIFHRSVVPQFFNMIKRNSSEVDLFFGKTEKNNLKGIAEAKEELRQIEKEAYLQAIEDNTFLSPKAKAELKKRVQNTDQPQAEVSAYYQEVRKSILEAVGDDVGGGVYEITTDAGSVMEAMRTCGRFSESALREWETAIKTFFSEKTDGIARVNKVIELTNFEDSIINRVAEITQPQYEHMKDLENALPKKVVEALAKWTEEKDDYPSLNMNEPFAVAQVILKDYPKYPALTQEEERKATELGFQCSVSPGQIKVHMLPPKDLGLDDPLNFPKGRVYPIKIEKIVNFTSRETGKVVKSFKVIEEIEIIAPSSHSRTEPCVVRVRRSATPQ